jgi:phage terminase small subunit
MPALRKPKHELFVRKLLEGENIIDAYEASGYSRDRGNASKLASNPRVKARLLELQEEAAKDSKLTVQSLLNELEDARKRATDLKQLSAAVRSVEAKARIGGLLIQKIEVGGVNEFEECQSTKDIVDLAMRQLTADQHMTSDELEHLHAMLDTWRKQMEEIVAYCQSKPNTLTLEPRHYHNHQTTIRRRINKSPTHNGATIPPES